MRILFIFNDPKNDEPFPGRGGKLRVLPYDTIAGQLKAFVLSSVRLLHPCGKHGRRCHENEFAYKSNHLVTGGLLGDLYARGR
jgi:hypothetical protein